MTQEYRTDIEPTASSSSGTASQAADAGKQAASDVASTAAGKAKDVADEAKRQTRDVLGEARNQLQEQAGTQHRNAVTGLRSLGDQLRSMSDNADAEGPATGFVAQAGDRVHGVASWLEEREPGQLVDEVRSFARQRPGAFLVGALVAGVVAGRLTRGVVDEHRDDSGTGTGAHSYTGSAAEPISAPPVESTYGAGYQPTQGIESTRGFETTPAFDVPPQPETPGYGVPSTPRNPA